MTAGGIPFGPLCGPFLRMHREVRRVLNFGLDTAARWHVRWPSGTSGADTRPHWSRVNRVTVATIYLTHEQLAKRGFDWARRRVERAPLPESES